MTDDPGRATGSGSPATPERVADGTERISVIVTVLNDRRVERTLQSLLAQSLPPFEVLVADGGSKDGTFEIAEAFGRKDPRVRALRLPGNIPETRNQALDRVRGDWIAFLDADEVAPPDWLRELTAPFTDPKVGFVGGPTPGMPGTTQTLGARYYDAYLRRFYETVAREHPHALPMGNSAWRKRVFDQVGRLDTSLFPRAASEDQDMANRTLRAGWKGVYAPKAGVDHDFSDIDLRGLLKKQSTYATGGYVLWRRSGSTYEASTGRLLPYVLPPALIVLGLVAALPWWLFHRLSLLGLVGELAAGVGVVLLLLLLLVLGVQGVREDRAYPGFRLRPLELLRRWATLWGALRGLVRYGWSGRRGLPAPVTSSSPPPAPRS